VRGRELTAAVSAAPRVKVSGRFERHVSLSRRDLSGSDSGGRWGPPGAYSVLYLGRPRDSVVVEAHRHLVEPFVADGMTGEIVAPRRLVRCDVDVTEILDLRSAEALAMVGLAEDDLTSAVDNYEACQMIGRVAHQLELHGVIAPAATGLGETLALFEIHLPAEELPRPAGYEIWDGLPADPRRLRVVRDGTA